MSFKPLRRIIYVALFLLLLAPAVLVQAASGGSLSVTGYQVTDQAVVVSVHNSGDADHGGVVSLLIRLRGQTRVTATVLSVQAGATVPVVFEIPREWAGSRLKIDVRLTSDGDDRRVLGGPRGKKAEGEDAPSEIGDNPHAEGNQITEGPDTVGG